MFRYLNKSGLLIIFFRAWAFIGRRRERLKLVGLGEREKNISVPIRVSFAGDYFSNP